MTRPGGSTMSSARNAPSLIGSVERRGQALERHLAARAARRDAGIVEALHLRRHLGEIDRHAVARDRDLDADRHALADVDAVVVHEGFRLIDAVRHLAHPRARQRLALVHDRFDAAEHGVAAVLADHVEEAPLAGLHRRDLGAEVAHGALRQPHVGADDRDQLLVRLAAPVDLHDRHLQAFGIDVRRALLQRAADVRPVRHAAREADHLAVVEHRHRERHVVEVRAGGVGVVGEQDVARLHVLRRRNA